jgi:hypothetical protein
VNFRVRIDPEAARAFAASGLDRDDLLIALNRLYSTLEDVPDAIRANRYRRRPELFLAGSSGRSADRSTFSMSC